MDAPKPINKFNEISSNNLTNDSSEFKLIFRNSTDSISFELIDLKSFPERKYFNIFNLLQLQGLNPYFKQFISIEKIIKSLNKVIENNQMKIKEESNDGTIIKIYFINPIDDEDNIFIPLNKKKEDQNNLIEMLCKTIKELKEDKDLMKKSIQELKEDKDLMKKSIQELKEDKEKSIQELKEENISLKKMINELNEKVNLLINNSKKENSISNLKEESIIITKNEDMELINSWISTNKNIKYKLLYRASKDGDKASDFHRLCDNIGPTLTIGKTPANYIFGGFTKAKWEKKDNIPDSDAFVFSLNQKKKFDSKNKKASISNQNDYGPIFGDGSYAIDIKNNILSTKDHWSNPKNSYGENLGLTEDKYFSVVELEVFLVEL